MRRKVIGAFALVALAVSSLPACYSLIEKPIAKARDFKPFEAKQYMAPCQYLQVEDVNLAFVEAGSGPTVVLIHGGFIPMNIYSSLSRTPFFDLFASFAINTAGVVYELLGLSLPLPPYPIIPPRAQTFAHVGAVATIDTWQYNFEELAKHFHVIALDLPGFGNSSKPNIQYKIEDFTRYLTGFLDAKKIDRASLAGLDVGGMIALDFVLAHPERVDKLVLINSEGTHDPLYNLGLTRIPYLNKFLVVPIFRVWQDDKAARINVWMPFYKHLLAKRAMRNVLHDKSQGIRRNYIAKDEGTSKEFMDKVINYKMTYVKSEEFTKEVHALHRTLVNIKRRNERNKIVSGLQTIQAPTLIIWGHENPRPKIKKDSGEAAFLDNAIPNSALSVFIRSGRFPMVEEPEAFNKEMILFLSGESPAPAAKSE
jgi:4,5:9,10-diseco-3-hydroxy-5,9,17-trioxoandrosta-1(10),2-diene-4-oate hydrolase